MMVVEKGVVPSDEEAPQKIGLSSDEEAPILFCLSRSLSLSIYIYLQTDPAFEHRSTLIWPFFVVLVC